MQNLISQIETVNALGRTNLAEKGVATEENITTFRIMQEILNIESGIAYKSVTYNVDGTVTIVDKDDRVITVELNYEDGKITNFVYNGKAVGLTYQGDELVEIGGTSVDLSSAPKPYVEPTVKASVGIIQVIPAVTIPTVMETIQNGATVQATSGIYYPCTLPSDYVEGAIYYTYADNVFTVAEVTSTTEGTYYRYSNDVVTPVEPSGAIYEETLTFAYDNDMEGYVASTNTSLPDISGTKIITINGEEVIAPLFYVDGMYQCMAYNSDFTNAYILGIMPSDDVSMIMLMDTNGTITDGEHTIKISQSNQIENYSVAVSANNGDYSMILLGGNFDTSTDITMTAVDNDGNTLFTNTERWHYPLSDNPYVYNDFYQENGDSIPITEAIANGRTITFTFTQTKSNNEVVTLTVSGEPKTVDLSNMSLPYDSTTYYCWGDITPWRHSY